MRKSLIKTALASAFATIGLAGGGVAHAGLTVTNSADCNALATTLAGGAGVTITGCSLVGQTGQQGTFTGGVSAGIGIASGVILTTGAAQDAVGPNSSDSTTVNLPSGGDAQLNGLTGGFTTQDANILNITFTTTTGSLFFKYVFASEEYNEYVNSSFNDVFGFFLNGANIALIPGTSTPVAINNVNCGYSASGGLPGTNPENCDLYNNNDLNNGGPFFDIEYDGFTDVFTASATGLTAGFEYTIKLAIGDTSDGNLDSAVFLQANSFAGEDPGTVPEPGTLALLGIGLLGAIAVRRRRAV